MMERKSPAMLVLLVSGAIGILGYLFFYNHDLGISVPIYISLVLGTMVAFAWYDGMILSLRRLWLLAPILFFATGFVFRANETLLALNAIAILGLTALMSGRFAGKYLDEVGWFSHFGALITAAFTVIAGPFGEIEKSLRSFKGHGKINAPKELGAVLRGIFIALPILVVFALLLGSADPIFQESLLRLTSWFKLDWDPEGFIEFGLITGIMSWVMVGAIVFSINPNPLETENAPEKEEPIAKKSPQFISLGMTEAGIVLGGVVALFAFFVLIQFTYLFGGQEIFLESMTFANYARRGFFELVAVSLMTLALMLGLDRTTLRRAQSQQLFFRISCVVLVTLTLVMLASAWQRMSLYEEAYGFSHLRLYTHVFMFWLGVLLVVGLLDIFRLRAHIFAFGALLVMIGYLGTLNIINVDAYIAQHNLARFEAGEELDGCYFSTLSADAVPAVLEFYARIPAGDAHDKLTDWLYFMRQSELARMDESRFLEMNFSHVAAYEALQPLDLSYVGSRECYGYILR